MKVNGFTAPNLQECLGRVTYASCYSRINVKAVFQYIPVDHDTKQFTGMLTWEGAYQYLNLQADKCP